MPINRAAPAIHDGVVDELRDRGHHLRAGSADRNPELIDPDRARACQHGRHISGDQGNPGRPDGGRTRRTQRGVYARTTRGADRSAHTSSKGRGVVRGVSPSSHRISRYR